MEYPALTEWMTKAKFPLINRLLNEEYLKRERLSKLSKITGIQYEYAAKLNIYDVIKQTGYFFNIVKKLKKTNLFSFRLIPTKKRLPKFRTEGKTIGENLFWFHQKVFNPQDYSLEIIPHDTIAYSGIFLINDSGIFGNIVRGVHWQLTRGNQKYPVRHFSFDYKNWYFDQSLPAFKKKTVNVIKKFKINKINQRTRLTKELKSQFTPHHYLKGYFEFIITKQKKFVLIDYNRVLLEALKKINFRINQDKSTGPIRGLSAGSGKIEGVVRIVRNPKKTKFKTGEILVSKTIITLDYLPLIKKAGAVITEQGNILSHAAIVARELGKPCLVGVRHALSKLKNGEQIRVDSDQGTIDIL